MKNIKLFDSLSSAIGEVCETPLVTTIKDMTEHVLYASTSDGDKIEIIENKDIDGFINYKLKLSHEYVDLGLPSGTLWATCNIGATSPEATGEHFSWAGFSIALKEGLSLRDTYNFTLTYSRYYSLNSKKYTKYNETDGLLELENTDDIAHLSWKDNWKIPSKEDAQELIINTTQEQIIVNGVTCLKFINKNDSNSYIILPFVYAILGTSDDLVTGYAYWTSTLNENNVRAYTLKLASTPSISKAYRYIGALIRPVLKQS